MSPTLGSASSPRFLRCFSEENDESRRSRLSRWFSAKFRGRDEELGNTGDDYDYEPCAKVLQTTPSTSTVDTDHDTMDAPDGQLSDISHDTESPHDCHPPNVADDLEEEEEPTISSIAKRLQELTDHQEDGINELTKALDCSSTENLPQSCSVRDRR